VFVVKSKGKTPLGRLWGKWEDNVEVDIKKMVLRIWTKFIWLWKAVLNIVMNLWVK
jgi:hypothetical protein